MFRMFCIETLLLIIIHYCNMKKKKNAYIFLVTIVLDLIDELMLMYVIYCAKTENS